jgi:hypothetical protein
MKQLKELQIEFQQLIFDKELNIQRNWIKSGYGVNTKTRLSIYHNAYRARLVEALTDTFAHTATYIGEEWFQKLALAYVQATPSTSTNIGFYGASFATWLSQTCPKDLDIAELADLDWRLRRAFDGANASPLQTACLATLTPQEWQYLHLQPVQTFQLIEHKYNTIEIWHSIDQDTPPATTHLLVEPTQIVIWRKSQSPHFRSLSSIECWALHLIENGKTFGHLCEQIDQQHPEVDAVETAGRLLGQWLTDQLLRS